MFSLLDLRFALWSLYLHVLRTQRILGFFIVITHKSTGSENLITWCVCARALTVFVFAQMPSRSSVVEQKASKWWRRLQDPELLVRRRYRSEILLIIENDKSIQETCVTVGTRWDNSKGPCPRRTGK